MRPLMLLVLGLAALAFAACTTSTPPTTEVDQDTGTEFPVSPAAEERSLDQDRSTNPNPDPTYHASTPNPIDVVYSTVASLPSGDPLSPLFGDRPEHGVAIDRLSSALKSAIVITPTEHLRANSRGRFLKIHYRDGVELRVRSVSWCEQWSGGKDFVGGFCSGEHRQLEDSWWVEGIGIVRSPALRSWWEDMPTFMVPIGSIRIPKSINVGRSFPLSGCCWADIVRAPSISLSLVASDGGEIKLVDIPIEANTRVFRSEVIVPRGTPSGRYFLRLSSGSYSVLVDLVQLD